MAQDKIKLMVNQVHQTRSYRKLVYSGGVLRAKRITSIHL